MKHITLLALAALLLFACGKEEIEAEPEAPNGVASAKINGAYLEFSPSMRFAYASDSKFNLLLQYAQGGARRKQLALTLLEHSFDLQKLRAIDFDQNNSPRASYATLLYDGDVAGNYYYLNEEDEITDFFQFTEFDERTGRVTGRFQASFVVDTSAIFDLASPDTIVITEGYFETVVVDWVP